MICPHTKKQKIAVYGQVKLYRCPRCQLVFSSKTHKNNFNYRLLYRNYYKNETRCARFRLWLEEVIKVFRCFRAFKIFTIAGLGKSILDIGCGRGLMLFFLKKYYHYTAVGTQLDPKAIRFAKNKLGLKIFGQDLLKIGFKKNSLDVVTMWHVLEHLQNPEKYLRKIYKLLRHQGKLVMEVPNFNSWSRKLTGKYWLGLDLAYHLNFFTPEALSRIVIRQGFQIKNIHTFSLEYSTFISAQSIISAFSKTDHLFFNWLQGRRFRPELILHFIYFILLTPICFLINLILYFSKKGEVLLLIAGKR